MSRVQKSLRIHQKPVLKVKNRSDIHQAIFHTYAGSRGHKAEEHWTSNQPRDTDSPNFILLDCGGKVQYLEETQANTNPSP